MEFSTITIYALHASDGEVRYVGQTNGSLLGRLGSHRGKAKAGSTDLVHVWMRETGYENICIEPLETCTPSTRKERERAWIAELNTCCDDNPRGLNMFHAGSQAARSAARRAGKTGGKVRAGQFTSEYQSVTGRAGAYAALAKLSPKERADRGRKMSEKTTFAQRSAGGIASQAAITTEERQRRAHVYWHSAKKNGPKAGCQYCESAEQ